MFLFRTFHVLTPLLSAGLSHFLVQNKAPKNLPHLPLAPFRWSGPFLKLKHDFKVKGGGGTFSISTEAQEDSFAASE